MDSKSSGPIGCRHSLVMSIPFLFFFRIDRTEQEKEGSPGYYRIHVKASPSEEVPCHRRRRRLQVRKTVIAACDNSARPELKPATFPEL